MGIDDSYIKNNKNKYGDDNEEEDRWYLSNDDTNMKLGITAND